ncbi:MAG: hypothetical protein KDN22_05180 [Verrucomicrobiae bacterium]|nr:hypothetical protein [Verrucomicrobiae bacterium]
MSNPLLPIVLLYVAAFTLTMILIANFIAPKKLNYKGNVSRMEPLHREVFHVHCLYTILTIGGMAALCWFMPRQLAGGSPLAVVLLWFMAGYWSLRVLIQFFFYNREIKKTYPVYNVMFTLAFGYLGLAFFTLAVATTFFHF